MPPVVSKGEKVFMYALFVAIDLGQAIIDIIVVDEWLNHLLDFVVGGFLAAYGLKRGLFTGNKALILGATFFAEQIPFVNAFPFWTYDLHNLYKGTVEQAVPTEIPTDGPFYQKGIGRPRGRIDPPNKNGVRRKNNIVKVDFGEDVDEDNSIAA